MRRARRSATAWLIAFTLLAAGGTAAAASCSLNVQAVLFGSYDALAAQSLDGVGTVSVTCDAFSSYSIALGPGQGSLLARRLQGPGGPLAYNLYTDVLRLAIWGDGTLGTALVGGSGTNSSFTIYGRIPPRQPVPAGAYGDTVTVTLLF